MRIRTTAVPKPRPPRPSPQEARRSSPPRSQTMRCSYRRGDRGAQARLLRGAVLVERWPRLRTTMSPWKPLCRDAFVAIGVKHAPSRLATWKRRCCCCCWSRAPRRGPPPADRPRRRGAGCRGSGRGQDLTRPNTRAILEPSGSGGSMNHKLFWMMSCCHRSSRCRHPCDCDWQSEYAYVMVLVVRAASSSTTMVRARACAPGSN